MTTKLFIVALALLSMSLTASTAVVKPVGKLDETTNAITETETALPNETESRGMVEVGNNGMVITLNPGPMLAGLLGLLAITGIGLGIAAAIAIPLGVVFGTGGNDYDDYDGFGNFARVWTAPPAKEGYGGLPAMSSYSTYSQRSLETMQPILETLANGLRKYSEDGKITYTF